MATRGHSLRQISSLSCDPVRHAGDTEKALDPYFPFECAVDVWARTFAALGINYQGATMKLDL